MDVTSQVVFDGTHRVVIHLTGISEGENESNVVKVNVSELEPPCLTVTIDKVSYAVVGGLVELKWDEYERFAVLTEVGTELCFSKTGNLVNDVDGSDGNILLSTRGFDLNSAYDITLELIKRY